MVDTLISYHRGGHVELVGGNLFLIHTTDGTVCHSGGNERATSGGNGPISSSTWKAFVRSVVVLFLAFCCVY